MTIAAREKDCKILTLARKLLKSIYSYISDFVCGKQAICIGKVATAGVGCPGN